MPDQPDLPALSDDDLRETLDLMATAVASMSDRIDDLTAVAPRGPPAHARAFDDGDLIALFGQMQTRRQAAITRADDANVDLVISLQFWALR